MFLSCRSSKYVRQSKIPFFLPAIPVAELLLEKKMGGRAPTPFMGGQCVARQPLAQEHLVSFAGVPALQKPQGKHAKPTNGNKARFLFPGSTLSEKSKAYLGKVQTAFPSGSLPTSARVSSLSLGSGADSASTLCQAQCSQQTPLPDVPEGQRPIGR